MDTFVLLPFVCAVLFILLTHTKFKVDRAARSQVTGNPLWKAQFFGGPFLIFCILWSAARSTPSETPWVFLPLILTPFVFNFGVEPWDLPVDTLFYLCFYSHHIAPVVACIGLQQAQQHDNISTALLFAHCWLLHPISSLQHWGLLNKQRIFWFYMLQGFIIKCFWWNKNYKNISTGITSALVVSLGVFMQYLGRWGLYLRLNSLVSDGSMRLDHFEWRKQNVEASAFVLAFLLCRVNFLIF